MDDRLRRQSDLFINNAILMRKGFLWDYASIQGVAAMMWSAYQKEVDVERIRQCKKALRDEAEVFCYLEDNAFVTAAAMLAISDNPPRMLKRLKKIYKMMLDEGFKPNSCLLLTALVLIRFHEEKDFSKVVIRAKHICLSLKSQPWHSMVAPIDKVEEAQVSIGKDVKEIIQREKYYRRLIRGEFPSPAIEEIISNVFIVDHRSEEKNVMHLLSLYATLKGDAEKEYFRQDYGYTVLAVLAMVTKEPEETMSRVFEVYDYLVSRRELESLKLDTHQYFYYAAMIVSMVDIERVRYSKYAFENDGDIFMAISMLPVMALAISRA